MGAACGGGRRVKLRLCTCSGVCISMQPVRLQQMANACLIRKVTYYQAPYERPHMHACAIHPQLTFLHCQVGRNSVNACLPASSLGQLLS